ncbi:MAG: HTTM domain-containing protein [Armatimonadetes bacterium]|nr:HTTM domain-containing protein [Armatimonadota bacterium]
MESIKVAYTYWFRQGSPVALGVFRAIMAGLIAINFCMISLFFQDWFSEKGYTPAWLSAYFLDNNVALTQNGKLNLTRVDLLYGITDYRILLAFNVIVITLAIMVSLGLFTRITSILLAIGVVTFHHRNSAILHGGDTVMRMCALYIAIAPSGAAFSLDRYFAVKAGKAPPVPPEISMWPQRLIAYNCSLLYFTTTWAKWFGVLWKSGAATWYPARLHEFDRFPVPGFFNQFPMVYVTTYGTLAVEFAMATLVWFKPLRKWVLLSGILLHGYIEYSMNIPLFSYLMISMYITYYEGDEVVGWWERVKARFGKKPSLEAA